MGFEERDRPLAVGRSFSWLQGSQNLSQILPPDTLRKMLVLEFDSEIEALERELKKLKAMRAMVAAGPKRKP